MSAEKFTYAGMGSGSKLVFLRGIMILTVDNQPHEIPIHFVLVSGFPGIAPKAYLSLPNDEEIIKNNPYVHKNMEILNQYMNNWKGFHVSYTLNTCYYYIYQSFLLCPPISSNSNQSNIMYARPEDMKEEPSESQNPYNQQRNGGQNEDLEFNKVCIISKVEQRINSMNRLIMKLSSAGVTMNKNADTISEMTDSICTKNAMLESEMETMEQNTENIEHFIEHHEGQEVGNVDEFVKPEDEVSEQLLNFLADERACEETIDMLKSRFRKKKISLDDYLESVRSLSNQQFMSMAKRKKISLIISAHNR